MSLTREFKDGKQNLDLENLKSRHQELADWLQRKLNSKLSEAKNSMARFRILDSELKAFYEQITTSTVDTKDISERTALFKQRVEQFFEDEYTVTVTAAINITREFEHSCQQTPFSPRAIWETAKCKLGLRP